MDSSGTTISSTILVAAVLALTTMNVVVGANSCKDDRDCSSEKWCYNVSGSCVEFIKCHVYRRAEGPIPSRHSSQCGNCLPGFAAEIFLSGVPKSLCEIIMISEETQTGFPEPESELAWSWLWIGLIIFGLLFFILGIWFVRKFYCTTMDIKFCTNMVPWSPRPTAPPQDEASFHLRGKSYPDDEAKPPKYTAIGINVVKDNLVNANAMSDATPDWVTKPHYDPDFNDNVAVGGALCIQPASTNIQMDMDDEEATNPSSWTPGQLTVDVPSRPFARFTNAQHNGMFSVDNCSGNSTNEESSSDDGAGLPEEPSGSRANGDTFCGPNVQINQTITLNIGKNGTK